MNKMVNMVSVVSEVNKVNEVTAANVTEKELRHELFKVCTEIENALIKLEKADILLNYWVQEYGFAENPEPKAAIEWSAKVPDKNNPDIKGEQSFKWFYEYKTIFNFVDMVFDYIIEAQEILTRTIKEVIESERTSN